MDFRALGDCLEAARRRGLVGEVPCMELADDVQKRQVQSVLAGGEGPAETNKGTGATSPGQVAGGRKYPLKLVVSNGRTVPHAAARRTRPGPAVRLFLATMDGDLVHSNLANSP